MNYKSSGFCKGYWRFLKEKKIFFCGLQWVKMKEMCRGGNCDRLLPIFQSWSRHSRSCRDRQGLRTRPSRRTRQRNARAQLRFLATRSRHQILCRDTIFGSRQVGVRKAGRVWIATETISVATRIEWPQVETWEMASRHNRDGAELTLGRDIDLRSRHGLAGWCVATSI